MNQAEKEMAESLAFRDLHPSLAEVVQKEGLDQAKLGVGLRTPAGASPRPYIPDVHEIYISDGAKAAVWNVPSLRALFRGDKVPPAFKEAPPPPYMPLFYFVEQQIVLFSATTNNPTDGDFEEAYSNLRRRPDGKHFSDLHRFIWQVAAVLAGIRPISAAEFDAIFGRLALSASHFRVGLVSRNYIETLQHVQASAAEEVE